MSRHKSKRSKAKALHKKVDNRFKDGVRKNHRMKISSGPNGKRKKKEK